MLELALTSFTTFFALCEPVGAAVIFATFTPAMAARKRAKIALRAVVIATIILVAFTLLGQPLLDQLGVTIPALQTAGGVILLIIGLDMIFARPTSAFKLTEPEGDEAQTKDDIAVFPIATPLLAGPGTIAGGILLATGVSGDFIGLSVIIGALLFVMLITLVLFILSHQLNAMMGVTAQRVLMRVFGILVAAIAVQAMFDGVIASGVFKGAVNGGFF